MALVPFICFLAACRPRTVVGGDHYFPPGVDSEAAQLRLKIEVIGPPGRSYIDRTPKDVAVTIWQGEKRMLSRDYKVTAGSLEWDVQWEKKEELEIAFFDFPEGVSIYSGSGSDNKARAVFSVGFVLDKSGSSFVEQPVPAEVVRRTRGSPSRKPATEDRGGGLAPAN